MGVRYSRFRVILKILASIHRGETSTRSLALSLGLPHDELDETMVDLYELKLVRERDQLLELTTKGRNIVEYVENSSDGGLGNAPMILTEP